MPKIQAKINVPAEFNNRAALRQAFCNYLQTWYNDPTIPRDSIMVPMCWNRFTFEWSNHENIRPLQALMKTTLSRGDNDELDVLLAKIKRGGKK